MVVDPATSANYTPSISGAIFTPAAMIAALLVGLALGTSPPSPSDARSRLDTAPALDSTARPVDGPRVLRRTVLALRIRFLVENWRVPDSVSRSPSILTRRDRALSALKKSVAPPDSAAACGVVRFVVFPADHHGFIPDESVLENTYRRLLNVFEGPVPSAPAVLSVPAVAQGTATARPFVYQVLNPQGGRLGDVDRAVGVSFQQVVLEGATAFFVDRAKADVARDGVQYFREQIERTPLAESTLARTLGVVRREYDQRDPRLFLPALQMAVDDDLSRWPDLLQRHEAVVRGRLGLQEGEWKMVLRAFRLAHDVRRGTHPLLALATFGSDPVSGAGLDPGLTDNLRQMGALAGALYAGQIQERGGVVTLRGVLEALDGRVLFAAFLRDETKGRAPFDPVKARELADRLAEVLRTLEAVEAELESLRERYVQVRAGAPSNAAALYADYATTVMQAVLQRFPPSGAGRLDTFRQTMEDVVAIEDAVVRRSYTRALQLAAPHLRRAVANDRIHARLTTALSTAALIGEADTPEATYDALVLLVAPPGSYRDKRGQAVVADDDDGRLGNWNVSINAFVGVTGGREWTRGVDGPESHGGAFVPVGVEFTRGFGEGSLGLFGSFVNLGSYADFSAGDDASSTPTYSFAQAWSPSLYVTLGFPRRFPSTIGFGRSYVPRLREVDGAQVDATRWSFFLAIDVPVRVFQLGRKRPASSVE